MKVRDLFQPAHNTKKKSYQNRPRDRNWFIKQYEESNEDPIISLYK